MNLLLSRIATLLLCFIASCDTGRSNLMVGGTEGLEEAGADHSLTAERVRFLLLNSFNMDTSARSP